jgi:hypothetical protein
MAVTLKHDPEEWIALFPKGLRVAVSTCSEEGKRPLAQRFLFVCGVARSGTTALAKLLSCDPQIALGLERVRDLARADNPAFTSELFSEERFFDFREADGMPPSRNPGHYPLLREKWNQCTFIGDKIPRLFNSVGYVLNHFRGAKMIYISRPIAAIAASWDRRAADPADHWPQKNDFKVAVREWNRGNAAALHWRVREPDRFLVMRYDNVFGPGRGDLTGLFGWLEIEEKPDFRRLYRALLEQRPSREPEENIIRDAYVAEKADHACFAELESLSI